MDDRLARLDWAGIEAALDAQGYATTLPLLDAAGCRALSALYGQEAPFRSRVVMQRHGFGRGEYKYFRYPLPAAVDELRRAIYPRLAPTANRWRERLKDGAPFRRSSTRSWRNAMKPGNCARPRSCSDTRPATSTAFTRTSTARWSFPLQMTVLLDAPGTDFTGGEFLLVEQRPRAQSKGEVVMLRRGEAVIFAVHHRPVQGTRGPYRVNLRHGVSRIRSGQRSSLGIIFHDAA